MLYIVATPIGNLSDITLRALSTLKTVDYILSEDTRRTIKLLSHYEIEKKLFSFHGFNEKKKEDLIINDLRNGKHIALVSDAGMPTISDPGNMLVKRCNLENLKVTCIPGASSVVTALALSGMNSSCFQFLGFFPKKPGEIGRALEKVINFSGTSIFFETPHRLLKTLNYLPDNINISIAKELTKIHESVSFGNKEKLKAQFEKGGVKGEFVLLLSNN